MPTLRSAAHVLGAMLVVLSAACSGDDGSSVRAPDRSDTSTDPNDTADVGGTATDDTADADAECEPGERECTGTNARRVCLPSGAWSALTCGEGEACEDGSCVPFIEPCVDGMRSCLDGEPAVCASGEWVGVGGCAGELRCSLGSCVTPACASAAAAGSYLGCEYLSSPLPNLAWGFSGTPASPLGIVLTNANTNEPASVWVYESDGETTAELIGEVTIEPTLSAGGDVDPVTVRSEILDRRRDQVEVGMTEAEGIEIPPAGIGIFLVPHMGNPGTTSVAQTSYIVRTDSPVAAYQFGPYCCNFSFTNDASLLFPTASLGRDYLFLGTPAWGSVGGEGASGSSISNTISVIGTQPNTSVVVDLPDGATVSAPTAGDVVVSGSRLTATVGLGDVLNVYGTPPATDRTPIMGVDLSGARITSTAPVSVFSGHECTYYPWDRAACDHLEEQLMPVETWGRSFVLAPPRFRSANLDATTETLYWKLIALEDDTSITLGASWSSLAPARPGFDGVPDCADFVSGPAELTLNSGEFCEFGTRRAFAVEASAPVQILGIISGADSVGFGAVQAGDPALFAVPPRRQFRTEYAFLAPTTYAVDYVTVVAPRNTVVLLDGRPIDLDAGASVAGSGDVFLSIPIDDGAHRIIGDQPIGILVYAYDDWVSYAYTGGLNLVKD